MPVEARGLFSGILQQGYALGYLIAAGFNMGIVPNSRHGFKILFYLGAGLTAAVSLARLPFPESKQFLERKKNSPKISGKIKIQQFQKEAGLIMKEYWKKMIYAVILMALFNYSSHTSQDMWVFRKPSDKTLLTLNKVPHIYAANKRLLARGCI
jgi:SHS family lactate transporter-like MFS transporter